MRVRSETLVVFLWRICTHELFLMLATTSRDGVGGLGIRAT